MLVESNQYGSAFVWGFGATDAPTITGAAIRAAQLKSAPQVDDEATDGEGHVEGNVVSKPAQRRQTATFSGYVTNAATIEAATDFTWNGSFWIITAVNFDRKKGTYADLSIEAKSTPGVTGPAGS